MVLKRISRLVSWCVLGSLVVCGVPAAEHHGQVRFAGLPLPGATVRASLGEQRVVAITDVQGVYTFPDLTDGVWKIQVEMLCFAPAEREVAIAANAPAGDWELKLLPLEQMNAVAAPKPEPGSPAPATVSSAAPPANPSNSKSEKQSAAQRPSSRNNRAAAPPPAAGQSGFQRTDVNASKDAGKLENEEAATPVSELNQSSFVVAGSVNNGAASPFAQSQAFGNMRKGPGPRYNGAIASTMDNSALNARSFSLTGQPTPHPARRRPAQ